MVEGLHMKITKNSILSLSLFFIMITFCIIVVFYSPYGYSEMCGQAFEPASVKHLLGTDAIGRDMLVRISLATILSIGIAAFSIICGLFIGVQYGCIAGFYKGTINIIMTSILDIIESIPEFLCAMMLMTFFNATIGNNGGILGILVTLVLTSWTSMARIIKNETAILVNENFVVYALTKKAGYIHILFYHLLPNLKGTIISTLVQKIPYAIFLEAFLSFVGIGIQPPFPSLGKMISEGVTSFRKAPLVLIIPSVFLFTIIFLLNFISINIREK